MDAKACPNMEKCPIYAHFLFESTKQSIIGLYCKSNYQRCERKKLKDAGQPVPEKLLPNGKFVK